MHWKNMEHNCMEYIKTLLGNLEKLQPEKTSIRPFVRKDSSIRAVVFDIYGTLLISCSGDIHLPDICTDNMETAMQAANINIADSADTAGIINELLAGYQDEIERLHAHAKQNGTPFPEVNILEIWTRLIHEAANKNKVNTDEHTNIRTFAFVFEILSNRTFPMPGMREVLNTLQNKNLPLGIISNAQFYTPVVVNYFLTGDYSNGETIAGISPELTVFSYKECVAKPDILLFEKILAALKEKYNISPPEVLFIGNDMYKDIYPAKQSGMKTALFAGDKRSLRMRENKKEIMHVKPDFIITELIQAAEIVG